MAGHYPGYGHPPPHGYPPGPPGHPNYMYPAPGVMFYPVNPAYFYPPPPPQNPDEVKVEEPSEDSGPTMPGETVELPYRSYRWVPACLSQRSIPMGALRVGTDVDGEPIYAGRAHHESNLLPAKVIPSKNACYVLVPATFAWQFASGGNVPPGAVDAGVTPDGEKLYYGRVTHDGCTTPGKIQPSHGVCYYPFDGEERNSAEYEVLVLM
ncbi:unnamed protein product [Leptidea sinapis]|uniref:Natterin-3 n=1 Tax=Leptidea sinapis TaxID=189913 RepID=A0A5E4R8R9_9NEOP|nr:unnamed protein product [Leptidea sinapis]